MSSRDSSAMASPRGLFRHTVVSQAAPRIKSTDRAHTAGCACAADRNQVREICDLERRAALQKPARDVGPEAYNPPHSLNASVPSTRYPPRRLTKSSRSLGAGGMGEVYRARYTRLKREVAIKVLPDAFANDPERLARFQTRSPSSSRP